MKNKKDSLVSIITRTAGRPVLLKRTLESIKTQTYKNYEVVIVNDGGDESYVSKEVQSVFKNNEASIIIITNTTSQGRWTAANQAIAASHGEFLVILDDDDTWSESYLDKSVKYLIKHSSCMGVVVESDRIDEEVSKGTSVQFIRQQPMFRYSLPISLFSLVYANQIPTNGFMYRRSAYKEVGVYDESLPVLGDWEFNIRFGLKYDFGVIREVLAFIHHRPAQDATAYANTVVAGVNEHFHTRVKILNKHFRSDMSRGSTGIGYVMNMQESQNEIRRDTNTRLEKLMLSHEHLLQRLEFLEKQSTNMLNKLDVPFDKKIRNYINNIPRRIKRKARRQQ